MSNIITTLLSGKPRILVLGDAMLDRYTWGHAERVSPEAPVLVLRTDEREVRLGGAASVAMLLAALEAQVSLATVIGDDHDGHTVRRLLEESGIDQSYIITDPNRPTTTKERFLGRADHRQPHQMLRVDSESRDPINESQVNELLNRLTAPLQTTSDALGRAKLPLSREVVAFTKTGSDPDLDLKPSRNDHVFPCFNGLEEAEPAPPTNNQGCHDFGVFDQVVSSQSVKCHQSLENRNIAECTKTGSDPLFVPNDLSEGSSRPSTTPSSPNDLPKSNTQPIKSRLEQFDAVLISDYGKGVCTTALLSQVIKLCRDAAIPVLVDPARGSNFETYRHATLMKPNRLEAELALSRSITSPADAIEATKELRDRYEFECVVITLDRDGLVFAMDDEAEHLPIAEQAICDITGAGDTVLAVLGLGLASTRTDLLKKGDWHPHCQTVHHDTTPSQVPVPFFQHTSLSSSSPNDVENHPHCQTANESKTPPQVPVPLFQHPQHASFADIAQLANRAASIQVAHPGVTPITRTQLQHFSFSDSSPNDVENHLQRQPAQQHDRCPQVPVPLFQLSSRQHQKPRSKASEKLITLETASQLATEYRQQGKKIVFTNGCFDLLHVGHVETLEAAAQLGDVLFVAVNSDDSVRQLKGPGRPVISEHDRAQMLCSLAHVDHVLIQIDATPHRILEAIHPEVLVKGGSTREIVGREIVERYGGLIRHTDEWPDRSTTALIEQIQSTLTDSQIPVEVP